MRGSFLGHKEIILLFLFFSQYFQYPLIWKKNEYLTIFWLFRMIMVIKIFPHMHVTCISRLFGPSRNTRGATKLHSLSLFCTMTIFSPNLYWGRTVEILLFHSHNYVNYINLIHINHVNFISFCLPSFLSSFISFSIKSRI